MKLLCIACFMLQSLFVFSQDSLREKSRAYKVFGITMQQKEIRGYLAGIYDSSLFSARVRVLYSMRHSYENDLEKISYADIDQVWLQRTGRVGRGALTGSLIGLSAGGIVGLIAGDDPEGSFFRTTAGEKAVIGAIFGAVTGALIGTIAGAASHKKFVIGGQINKFLQMQEKMRDALYGSHPGR